MILVITYVAGDGRYNWDVLVTFFVDVEMNALKTIFGLRKSNFIYVSYPFENIRSLVHFIRILEQLGSRFLPLAHAIGANLGPQI